MPDLAAVPNAARPRARRWLLRYSLGALAVALCTTVAVAAIAIGAISTIAHDLTLGGKPVRSPFLKPPGPAGAETILVIGDDHSGPLIKSCNCHQLHADTFMLVHMDPNQGQTSIMSIPRDLLVSFKWNRGQYNNQKFNATYSVGGRQLVLQVASQTLPGISINHVIDVNFSAFIGVVRAIGCVYIDVDHRYLNNLDPSYQPINLQPGYQRLCAEPALSYVRYRHLDSDFVRVARQQDFIRQAKEQLGLFDLVLKFDQIAKAFGRAIRTDIHTSQQVNDLLQLVASAQAQPIRQVPFLYSDANYQIATASGVADYVLSTPQLIQQSTNAFLNAHLNSSASSTSTSTGHTKVHVRAHHRLRAAKKASSLDLFPLSSDVRPQALALRPSVSFPIYLPRYQTGPATSNDFHPYTVYDPQGHIHYGYRVDWYLGTAGEYYGIEGMNWTSPPLFAHPSATQRTGGRTFLFVDDPPHFHDIGWRVGNTLYWVSNTLNETLTNAQMLALAESAHAITIR